ncbi:MAG: hypothetical protein AB8B56_07825 [Crocinitomicaceae bacterium]
MSYLHLPRIVFSGDFISDVSTVNNTVAHYDVQTFKPSFQDYDQRGKGLWNPEGGATFDFQNCIVKKLFYSDGSTADATSNVMDLIGEFIQGAEGRSAGKMVDLDPQQQLVSELWAVKLRITNAAGDEILVGNISTTAFRDLQTRQTDGAKVNGQSLGASWTTTLENIVWGEKANDYQILKELKAETHENRLSVNLNGFGYYYTHAKDGRFSLGRLIGSMGPWYKDEPITFVAERRLYGTKTASTGATFFNLTNFLFDESNSRLSIDFGASFPVLNSMGEVTIKNKYILAVSNKSLSNAPSQTEVQVEQSDFEKIGDLVYSQGEWLMDTGGLIDIKLDSSVSDKLKNNQLILLKVVDDKFELIARESISGYNVRPDQMVRRIDTDQVSPVDIYAKQWGNPVDSGTVSIQMAPATKTKPGSIAPTPGINTPQTGLAYDVSPTVSGGIASIKITGNKIHCPRKYLDGQIYHLLYSLNNMSADPAGYFGDFISIHLRDYFEVPDNPTWYDIKDTMQQFSNLYPIMSKYLVDLGDRDAILARKEILEFAFSQDIHSPMYMPVTRDLSETKRLTILAYLESGGKYDHTEAEVAEVVGGSAAGAMMGMKSMANTIKAPAGAPEVPSDFHQKLIAQTRAKMGAENATEPVEDLTKL